MSSSDAVSHSTRTEDSNPRAVKELSRTAVVLTFCAPHTLQKVEGALWLAYSVWIHSGLRPTFEILTSSSGPFRAKRRRVAAQQHGGRSGDQAVGGEHGAYTSTPLTKTRKSDPR